MRSLCVALLSLLALPGIAAPLEPGGPLPVRVLYDNSGSMYSGYRPPGSPGRRTREQLGAHFFHQLPQFVPWLDEFVQRQSAIGATTVDMSTFTSSAAFTPNDIAEVHRTVPLRNFRGADAVANFPARAGHNTYLTETLTEFTRGFTGVVWLITDNIVEANNGQPDAGVQQFFETLARSPELRSVHLFKHTFEENGRTAALAMYGIVVSSAAVPEETLAHYDDKFRGLFPGREHLKLKNLSIRPLTLRADLQLLVADRDKGMFGEGQSVQLELDGEIRSRLTQHTVTAGRYELAIASPFLPESWAQRDLGATPLPPEIFDSAGDEIRDEIPPNGTRRIKAVLRSNQPVSFTPTGIAEWLRLAWNGAAVRYTGTVRMSLTDVNVRLQRQQMAGIFGIDRASSVFAFQDVTTISGIRPSVVPVSFALRTGSSRTAVLLGILAVLAAFAIAAALVLSRKQTFRITIANGPQTIVALRRLGTHDVTCENKLLGRLSRGLANGYTFDAVRANPEFTVLPAADGETWDVRFTGGPNRRLTIKAEGGGVQKPQKPAATASRAAPPPHPPLSRSMPPPGRPPRIGR